MIGRRRHSSLALLGLLASVTLAACGGAADESSTVTATETVLETESSTASTATSTATASQSTTTGSAAEGNGGSQPADRTVTELTGFTSPTGNIGCYIDPESVRCDIAERGWEPPKAPRSCKADYGQGIALTPGATPEFVCAGDTALQPDGDPLPYGESIAAGLLRCESAESGITCRDAETGRGFSLAKEAYELF